MKKPLKIKGVAKAAVFAILFVLAFLRYAYVSQAQSVINPGRSYRSLALGNTGVASATDNAALYYNPAILANVEGWWFDYSAWTFEGSQNIATQDAGLMLAALNFPHINREGIEDEDKETFLEKENPFLRANAAMHISMNLVRKGFAIAASYMQEVVYTTKTVDEETFIYQRDDIINKVGLSIPIGMGSLVVGLGANRINRRVAEDATTDSIPNWSRRYEGTGYDLGLLYRMPTQAHVTWGLVVQNYGDVKYGNSDIEDPQQVALGVSINQELGLLRLFPAIDVRQVIVDNEQEITIHAGLEVGLFPNSTGGNYLTYRIGYNQGYATQGVELNLFNHWVIIGYTQYGEEVGQDNDKVENRRNIMYISLGF